jgi:hypothetical protein
MNMLPAPAIIDVSIDPVLLHLGPLTVRWYGVLFASALLLGGWMAVRHLLPRGLDRDTVHGLLLWSGVDIRELLRDVLTRRTNRLLRILVLATSSVVDAAGPTRLRRRLHRLRARTATFSEPQ